jgi:hypothetical protein
VTSWTRLSQDDTQAVVIEAADTHAILLIDTLGLALSTAHTRAFSRGADHDLVAIAREPRAEIAAALPRSANSACSSIAGRCMSRCHRCGG